MITDRQEKILQHLVAEYIDSAEPISSELLKKKYKLAVSPATIRNDFQELAEQGYIEQPHTSAGRIPTQKGYQYFVDVLFAKEVEDFPNFIFKEIETARQKIEKELEMARELMQSLTQISLTLHYTKIEKKDSLLEILKIIGPSRTTYEKNIDLMRELLEEFENF